MEFSVAHTLGKRRLPIRRRRLATNISSRRIDSFATRYCILIAMFFGVGVLRSWESVQSRGASALRRLDFNWQHLCCVSAFAGIPFVFKRKVMNQASL
ncbi:hypothetical protein F5Y15DRAFT_356472 [Xylariaceae sp. FL0016]|nr:hypothetical protein F5Y15DRAFT_356472 [Xylariaceae sp. FL0016]